MYSQKGAIVLQDTKVPAERIYAQPTTRSMRSLRQNIITEGKDNLLNHRRRSVEELKPHASQHPQRERPLHSSTSRIHPNSRLALLSSTKSRLPLLSSPSKSQSLSHSHTRKPHAVCDQGPILIGSIWREERN